MFQAGVQNPPGSSKKAQARMAKVAALEQVATELDKGSALAAGGRPMPSRMPTCYAWMTPSGCTKSACPFLHPKEQKGAVHLPPYCKEEKDYMYGSCSRLKAGQPCVFKHSGTVMMGASTASDKDAITAQLIQRMDQQSLELKDMRGESTCMGLLESDNQEQRF